MMSSSQYCKHQGYEITISIDVLDERTSCAINKQTIKKAGREGEEVESGRRTHNRLPEKKVGVNKKAEG